MKSGKVNIVDKCTGCGKLTDNDTGKTVEKKDLDKYVYVNNWICNNCTNKLIKGLRKNLKEV